MKRERILTILRENKNSLIEQTADLILDEIDKAGDREGVATTLDAWAIHAMFAMRDLRDEVASRGSAWSDNSPAAKALANLAAHFNYPLAAAPTPPVSPEPNSRAGVEHDINPRAVAKAMDEDGGWWKSCSGCCETVDGLPAVHYSYSSLFRCFVGAGCVECGGIGVRWEYYSEVDIAAMAEELATPTPAPHPGPIDK